MKKTFILLALVLALFSLNAQTINNLYVSPTGWAMWEGDPSSSYNIYLNGELVKDNLNVTYYQHENIVDGQNYTTKVSIAASDDITAEYSWTKANCDGYAGAANFTAGLINNVGILSWTLPAIYKGNDSTKEGTWLHYDNDVNATHIGLTYDGVTFEQFKWGIMFPASDITAYAGQSMTKVSIYDCEAFDGEVFIYGGGSTQPETLLFSQEFSCTGSETYKEIELNTSVEISGNENIWVVFTHYNGRQPASGCADQGDPNSRWIYYEGYGWLDNMMVSMPPYTWQIRAYVTEYEDPVISEVLGVILYRNGELLSELVTDESYIDTEAQADDEYTLRVVYAGQKDVLHYFMACPQTAKIGGVSIAENTADGAMIYPNPTNGDLNINVDGMNHVSVINTLGQVVYDKDVDSNDEVVDMSQYKSGIYIIRIATDNDVIVRQVSVKR